MSDDEAKKYGKWSNAEGGAYLSICKEEAYHHPLPANSNQQTNKTAQSNKPGWLVTIEKNGKFFYIIIDDDHSSASS